MPITAILLAFLITHNGQGSMTDNRWPSYDDRKKPQSAIRSTANDHRPTTNDQRPTANDPRPPTKR